MNRDSVIVTPEAQQNIDEAFGYIAERSPLNAGKWIRGLERKIEKLALFPRGFGDAREQPFFDDELRQLIYKSHRIIYTIDDKSNAVIVVQVRHLKRRATDEPSRDD